LCAVAESVRRIEMRDAKCKVEMIFNLGCGCTYDEDFSDPCELFDVAA